MKPIDEWDENYVLNLPPGEHDWVEFKGSMGLDLDLPNVKIDKVLNELSKQVSAFGNSGGGTLIYGVKDSSEIPREVDLGGVSLNLRGKSTKEWLEDVLGAVQTGATRTHEVYRRTRTFVQPRVHSRQRRKFHVELSTQARVTHSEEGPNPLRVDGTGVNNNVEEDEAVPGPGESA